MIKAVIFDMDGLMIETEHLQSKSIEHVLREHGVEPEFNPDGVIQKVGVTAKDNFIWLKEKHNIEADVETLLDKKKKVYQDLLTGNIKPKKGLLNLLEMLKENNFKLAVASSSGMGQITTILEGMGVKDKFDALVSGENLKRGKPAPDIFLEAAKRINTEPAECAVLEDAQSGVEAGRSANMKVIAVPNQYTRSHDFDKADAIVSSLEEVNLELLASLS